MPFLKSSNIIVFPSTRRFDKQISARTLSESSFVGLINQLVDTDGFVITPDEEDLGNIDFTKSFEFNIHGYYFKANKAQDIIDNFTSQSDSEIYANIRIEQAGNYRELQGQDIDNPLDPTNEDYWRYEGVEFSNTDLTQSQLNPASYSLLIFVKEDGVWSVPVESRIKFNSGIALGVDGGVI